MIILIRVTHVLPVGGQGTSCGRLREGKFYITISPYLYRIKGQYTVVTDSCDY